MHGARKPVLVGGLGNPLMGDEGTGVHLVRLLAGRADRPEWADFVDLGSSMMNVVHAMANRETAVLIDCAFMGEAPGTMRGFSPDGVRSTKCLAHLSLHEGDLAAALSISRQLDEYPGTVIIFGIQPEQVTAGHGLSSALQERCEDYCRTIFHALEQDRGECVSKLSPHSFRELPLKPVAACSFVSVGRGS